MSIVHIELGKDSYDILIGKGLAIEVEKLIEDIKQQKRMVVVVTDENVVKAGVGFLKDIFSKHGCPIKVLEAGEKSKSLKTAEECYDFLIQNGVGRSSVLFAVGGGVVGDLVGFVAATYMRGIDYYQIPTTFLAMVDSSVGGKTGVNLPAGKNLVGAFHQPKGVFIDTDFIRTLPSREFIAGMAEVIKYALIADREFFQELEVSEVINSNSPKIAYYIEKACRIKGRIVQKDEKERNGNRSLLNLGHTFGHAIESATGYKDYLHGEAVSIGLIMAVRLSALLGYLDEYEVERIKLLLERYELPTSLRRPIKILELNQAMHHDKKTEAGVLYFIILKKIGEAAQKGNINEKWIHTLWYEVDAED